MRKKTSFVLGDLNDSLLQGNSKLSCIIKNNKLSQVLNKPTRITLTSATLLDVIITNKPELGLCSDVIPRFIADLDLITTTVNISKPKLSTTLKTFQDLSHYDKDTFCWQLLSEVDNLDEIFYTDNVNEQVNTLTSVVSKSLDSCVPITTKELGRLSAPWMTNEMCEVTKARNKAQNILKADRLNITLQNQYEDLKKRVKKLLYK